MSVLLAALLAGAPFASTVFAPAAADPPAFAPAADEAWLGADLDGRLDADVFVVVDERASELLRSGDERLALSRRQNRGDASSRTRQFVQCIEAWHSALDAPPGALVGWSTPPPQTTEPGPEDADAEAATRWSERLYEGVEAAVLRRVAGLSAEERTERRERLGALADARWRGAFGNVKALAETERGGPGLDGALAAALQLGDIALEAGRALQALGWYERAERHAALGAMLPPRERGLGTDALEGTRQPAADALDRRLEAARSLLRPASTQSSATQPALALGAGPDALSGLAGARRLRLEAVLPLVPGQRPGAPPRGRSDFSAPRRSTEIGGGLRHGLAFLADGRVVVHGDTYLTFADPLDRSSVTTIDWTRWLGEALPGNDELARTWSRREAPGWSLSPVALDGDVALVFGRGNNLLAVVTAPARFERPTMRWATDGFAVYRATSNGVEREPLSVRAQPDSGSAPEFEFQPGAVRVGELLVIEAREIGEGVRSMLLAFEARSGRLAWSRFLARGSDRVPEVRPGPGFERALPAAGPALARRGSHVFAGTHLGLGAYVDSLDGRIVWALATSRREPEERGWTGSRPIVTGAGSELVWAPADSRYLYRLRAGADALLEVRS